MQFINRDMQEHFKIYQSVYHRINQHAGTPTNTWEGVDGGGSPTHVRPSGKVFGATTRPSQQEVSITARWVTDGHGPKRPHRNQSLLSTPFPLIHACILYLKRHTLLFCRCSGFFGRHFNGSRHSVLDAPLLEGVFVYPNYKYASRTSTS